MATLHFCQNFTFVQILTDFFFFRKNITFVFFTVIYAIYKFSCKNTDIVFRPKFLTSQTKWHFHKNFTRVNFILFFLLSFWFVPCTFEYTIYKFSCKNGDIAFWSKFLASQTWVHFRTNFKQFFFFPKEFYICFYDLYLCYIQIFLQKHRNCIPVKILN